MHHKSSGIPKTCGRKQCLSKLAKRIQPSKYEKLFKLKVYCQCRLCKPKGECRETRIDLSQYTARDFGKNPHIVKNKLKYKKGHLKRKLNVKVVEKKGRKPSKKILKLLTGEVDFKIKLKYSMGQPEGTSKVYVPAYCKGCGKTKFETVHQLWERRNRKGKETQMLCKACGPLGQKRKFCFCGLERKEVSKNVRKKGGGKFCKHHTYTNKKYKQVTREIKMLVEGMPQKEAVKVMIEKVHLILEKQRDNETELVMCLVELEKLEAEKHVEVYSTFGELIEGEFGWTEIKFKSAKNMLLSYGAERFREYGRETLQCLSRLDETGRADVFHKLQDYKAKRNKVPTYGTVSGWVREACGKVQEKQTGPKVVNIKKKYLEALEEIKNLNKMLREQSEEIARLNVYIKGKKA